MEKIVDNEAFTKGLCVARDLVIEGRRSQDLFDDESAFIARSSIDSRRTAKDIFDDLLNSLNNENKSIKCDKNLLKSYCIKLRNNQTRPAIPQGLRGISGFNSLLYIEEFLIREGSMSVHELNLPCEESAEVEYRSKLCGQIRDYVFLEDKTKKNIGSGHLAVELIHEQFCTRKAFLDCKPDRVTLYHWDIEIEECCFEVHFRDDYGFPDNPFPTLEGVEFPDHSLDPDDERSIWFRCLDHKLFAKGECIKIHNIYRQIDDGKFHLLDKVDYQDLYESNDQSCVDLMFKGYPPATQLPVQTEYCLGRCEKPPIINSGGK